MSNFNTTKGSAQAAYLPQLKLENGENTFRIVGDILRRYIYWVKSPAGKAVCFECLSFNRDLEKFDNKIQDHVPTFYPNKTDFHGKVVIDRKDGKLKELHLKKTMFEDLIKVASKKSPVTKQPFGDPTDPVTGWDISVNKEKTGPAVMNVKYSVDAFSPINGAKPLTDEEIQMVEDSMPIEERHERPTPEDQLALLLKIQSGEYDAEKDEKAASKDAPASSDMEAVNELS
jgi:hypothetical protein